VTTSGLGGTESTVSATPKPIPRSLDSFKVLTECPIIIALLFQLHKKYVGVNVPALVPLIVKVCFLAKIYDSIDSIACKQVINLQPKAQKEAHEKAALEGRIFTGMSPPIKNKVMYSELKALQIKVGYFAVSHL
jgi:transformation/transcription domain-associated protein